ncbi:unnamed protein product, partial [Nesidiocoris tenuis]
MVDVVIHRYEIIKILANFGKQIPLMFYYTTPACAQKIRKLIGMSNEEPRSAPFYYYNPASKVEPYRRITLLPEKVGEEPRLFILSTYDEQCLIEVLTDPEANNILVTAHPNAVDAAVEASQPAIQSRPISTTPARPSSVSTPTAQQTPQQQTQQQLMLLQQQQSSGLSVIQTPCILIFDSLIGGSRAKVCATLREFMQIEYNVKHRATKGRRDFTADSFRASVVKVPQQTNFTDCGLYLLQFAETFFQKPIRDYRMPIKELVNWFDVEVVNRKRFEIQQLLHKLMDEQKVDVARLNLPDLELNPEGTSGGPRFMDGDDEMVGMGVNEMGDEGDISGDMDMMDADYEELEEEEEDEEMMDDELAEEDLR